MTVDRYTSIRISINTRNALHILKHEMRYSSIEKVLDRLIVLGIRDIKEKDDVLYNLAQLDVRPATED